MVNRGVRKYKITGYKCPLCGCESLHHDYTKAEEYCTKCGLVTSTTDHYVGVEKIRVERPYPIYTLLENIHYKYTSGKSKSGTSYKHTLSDKDIVKHNRIPKRPKPYIFHIME